ncbi:MAG TPA: TIGR04552 family protein [Myxococcota bacterium]|nr:TIGR04552 family protein [Myxococcota bacterium]
MRQDILELDATVQRKLPELELTPGDVEALRLVLSGSSVIDWHKAAFPDVAAVDRTLRLHLLDPDDRTDMRRLRYVYNEAVAYVEEFRGMRLPPELRAPTDVRDVFLWASDTSGFRRRQMLSCMVLKLMHVISHLEAADLKLRADVSEYDLHQLAHRRVVACADRMRADGFPLTAFYGSRKTRASVIQKLLAKRDNVAATIFDKLRYRVIVPELDDVLPVLSLLTSELVPFNHIIPGESHNNLLDPADIEARLSPEEQAQLQPMPDDPIRLYTAKNEFSGSTYRMINFITDLPVRLADHQVPPDSAVVFGRVVYVMVELQIVDAVTAASNEAGDNAHARYKARQRERVKARLGRGAYVKS